MSPAPLQGGVFAAALTLFTSNGEPDWPRWREYLQWLCAEGLDGVLIMGTTGEFTLLSLEERLRGIAEAREALPSNKRMIVNIGAMTTAECVALAKRTYEVALEGDALLAGPPYYYQKMFTPKRFVEHFRTIAEATELPLMYYHIPKMSHFNPGPELLIKTAEKAPLHGIKDSDGELDFQEAVQRTLSPRDFVYLSGRPGVLLNTWKMSNDPQGCGSITGLAAGMPAAVTQLWNQWQASETEIEDLHRRLSEIWRVVSSHGVPGVRALVGLMNPDFANSQGRAPFISCPDDEIQGIATILNEMGFPPAQG